LKAGPNDDSCWTRMIWCAPVPVPWWICWAKLGNG
jgi:hypothetical protein